jgi:hypothetical protein
MSAGFANTGNIVLSGAPAVVTYPFTMAVWVYPFTINTAQSFVTLTDNTVSNQFFNFGQSSGATMVADVNFGGSTAGLSVTGTAANKWQFGLYRAISATNRRLSAVWSDGSMTHAQSTTSRSPGTINTMAIGRKELSTPTGQYNGRLAEFWWCDADVQADGAQINESFLRQLAFGGPLSVPHVKNNLIEYRSFRVFPDTHADRSRDVYFGRYGPKTWTATSVTTGPHVPLPPSYAYPVSKPSFSVPRFAGIIIGTGSNTPNAGPMVTTII